MATDESPARGRDDVPPDDFTAFLNTLNELKANGCNLLVVGDTTRDVFARASSQLLGNADVMRYRVLAITDASPQSVADRLPDPDDVPRPLAETSHLVNHAGVPRSVTAAGNPATPSKLDGIEEICVADPELRGLESALCDAIGDVVARADDLPPAALRVGVDSLGPLLDHHDADVIERCIDAVGERMYDHDGMAHYVLPKSYDSDWVQTLVPNVDAVVELQTVDPDTYGHDTQQRWHVPQRSITTEWTPL